MPDYIDLGKNPQLAKQRMGVSRDKIIGALGRGMEKSLAYIEGDAKREVKADLGRLRASITHRTTVNETEIRGRVGTNVEYGPYYHEGTGIYATNGNGRQTPWVYKDRHGIMHFTRGMHPHPFLRLAKDKNRERIGRTFVEEVRQLD